MTQKSKSTVGRRQFLKGAAVVGAGATLLSHSKLAQAQGANAKPIKCALIGAGAQGLILLRDSLKVPGVQFQAVCDIWKYGQKYASSTIVKARVLAYRKKHGSKGLKAKIKEFTPRIYLDFKEMLAKEKDLDAVIVATPDFWHGPHSIACMKAGVAVYCEKEMSNTLENAVGMVKAARETKQIVQIGHQRRSNPIYTEAYNMITKDGLIGRPTSCYGQWNRSVQPLLTFPDQFPIDAATLTKYGYENREQFRNWRWYKKYSGGPICDLGSHQIDIFSWFLDCDPDSVSAIGNASFYKDRQWYSDVMTMYEYPAKAGKVQSFYQVQNTNGYGNYFERFMGDKGTVTISEDRNKCYFVAETGYDPPAYVKAIPADKLVERDGYKAVPLEEMIKARSAAGAKLVAARENKNVHQLHLENFFQAVRAKDAKLLTCDAEHAYPTAVAVLNTLPAIAQGKKFPLPAAAYKI